LIKSEVNYVVTFLKHYQINAVLLKNPEKCNDGFHKNISSSTVFTINNNN